MASNLTGALPLRSCLAGTTPSFQTDASSFLLSTRSSPPPPSGASGFAQKIVAIRENSLILPSGNQPPSCACTSPLLPPSQGMDGGHCSAQGHLFHMGPGSHLSHLLQDLGVSSSCTQFFALSPGSPWAGARALGSPMMSNKLHLSPHLSLAPILVFLLPFTAERAQEGSAVPVSISHRAFCADR